MASFVSILKTNKNTIYNVCICMNQKCKNIKRANFSIMAISGREEVVSMKMLTLYHSLFDFLQKKTN